MALTLDEQDTVRTNTRFSLGALTETKPVYRAAATAIDDFMTANTPAISAAINQATSPIVLNAATKKAIFAAYCLVKFIKDK